MNLIFNSNMSLTLILITCALASWRYFENSKRSSIFLFRERVNATTFVHHKIIAQVRRKIQCDIQYCLWKKMNLKAIGHLRLPQSLFLFSVVALRRVAVKTLHRRLLSGILIEIHHKRVILSVLNYICHLNHKVQLFY